MRSVLPHPAALAGPPVAWRAAHRILVVRPDNLGDVVMTGPALRALRAASPTARITLLASPAGAAVAPLLPEVDDVVIASPTWQDAGVAPPPRPEAELELVSRLAQGRYDVAVVLTSFGQSPWPAAAALHLAGVPVRIGTSREFGGTLLTHWVPAPPDGLHQVDRALEVLAAVGVPAQGTDLRVEVPEPAGRAAAAVLAGLGVPSGAPYALLLPGASCSARRWSPAGFAEVAAALARDGRVAVVAGSARETDLLSGVAGQAAARAPEGSVVTAAGVLDVPALAAVVAGADVAVVNNSGGMHLADAVRTPAVVLFAGTERQAEYAPRSAPAVVLTRPTACSPCRQFRCPFAHECLDVEPRDVAAAAMSVARSRVAA